MAEASEKIREMSSPSADLNAGLQNVFHAQGSGFKNFFDRLWGDGGFDRQDFDDLWGERKFWSGQPGVAEDGQEPGEPQLQDRAPQAQLQHSIDDLQPEFRTELEQKLGALIGTDSVDLDRLAQDPAGFLDDYRTQLSTQDRALLDRDLHIVTVDTLQQRHDGAIDQDDIDNFEPSEQALAFAALAVGSGSAGRLFEYLRTRDVETTTPGADREKDKERELSRQLRTQMILNDIISNINAIDVRVEVIDRELEVIAQRREDIRAEKEKLIADRERIDQENRQIEEHDLPAAEEEARRASEALSHGKQEKADLERQLQNLQEGRSGAEDRFDQSYGDVMTATSEADALKNNTLVVNHGDVYVRTNEGWQNISGENPKSVSEEELLDGQIEGSIFYRTGPEGQIVYTNAFGVPLSDRQTMQINQKLEQSNLDPQAVIASFDQYRTLMNTQDVHDAEEQYHHAMLTEEDFNRKIRETENALEETKQRIRELEDRNEAAQAKVQSLVEKVEDNKQKLAEIDEKLGVLSAEDLELLKREADLSAEKKQLLEQREELSQQAQKLTEQYDQSVGMASLSHDTLGLSRDLAAQQEESLILETEMGALRAEHGGYAEEIMSWGIGDGSFEAVRQAYEAGALTEDQLDVYENFAETAQGLKSSHERLSELDNSIAESESKIAALEDQIKALEEEQAEIERQLQTDKKNEAQAKQQAESAQERRLTNWDGETVYEDTRFGGLGLSYKDGQTGEIKEHGMVASLAGQVAHAWQDYWKDDAQTGNQIDNAKDQEEAAAKARQETEQAAQQKAAEIQALEQQKAQITAEIQEQKARQTELDPDREYNTSRVSAMTTDSGLSNAPSGGVLSGNFQSAVTPSGAGDQAPVVTETPALEQPQVQKVVGFGATV